MCAGVLYAPNQFKLVLFLLLTSGIQNNFLSDWSLRDRRVGCFRGSHYLFSNHLFKKYTLGFSEFSFYIMSLTLDINHSIKLVLYSPKSRQQPHQWAKLCTYLNILNLSHIVKWVNLHIFRADITLRLKFSGPQTTWWISPHCCIMVWNYLHWT